MSEAVFGWIVLALFALVFAGLFVVVRLARRDALAEERKLRELGFAPVEAEERIDALRERLARHFEGANRWRIPGLSSLFERRAPDRTLLVAHVQPYHDSAPNWSGSVLVQSARLRLPRFTVLVRPPRDRCPRFGPGIEGLAIPGCDQVLSSGDEAVDAGTRS